MRPIAEFPAMERERFEREIVPRGEPAVLRGLVEDWPVVDAAKASEEALADFIRQAASDEPFEAWFGAPEIGGRFSYNRDFSGFPRFSVSISCCGTLSGTFRRPSMSSLKAISLVGLPVSSS